MDEGEHEKEDREHGPTGLIGAPLLPPTEDLEPAEVESYVRAAMHQDRTPGQVLVVAHPLRMYKVPRKLFGALRDVGFDVQVVHTEADRLKSITQIRDGLVHLSKEGRPLDLMVISGDGTLDHHVLIAAFWAFYPDDVKLIDGEFSIGSITAEEWEVVPAMYRRAFFSPLPEAASIDPSEDNLKEVWKLRLRLESVLRKERSVQQVLAKAERPASDALLRLAVLSVLLPHRVRLVPRGLDLAGLVGASQEKTFQGLYPFLRSITVYPAGTAADNAFFAGVPGWEYAQLSKLLAWPKLDGLRRRMEDRVVRRFVEFYAKRSVVVPARFSVLAVDGHWSVISSHAAGGPAAGHFFSADLMSKTKGLMGYLAKIPQVILQEGILGSTVVRIRASYADGRVKSFTEGQIAEGLYTNRTVIGGIGSVPTTNPTSFAGQSSLIVVPPIWYRNKSGRRQVNLRGLATLVEGIFKGFFSRVLHGLGIGVGTMAGGGKFSSAWPEHQVAITEGEEIEMEYLGHNGLPRSIPIQVSGDPYQACRLSIRVAWGPIPLLAHEESLLLAAAKRSLAQLRVQQSYRLDGVYIGGLYYYRHHIGPDWSQEFSEETGLFAPPQTLRRRLSHVQTTLIKRWQELETGPFVDTTESGLQMGRRGRYAHNNDQSAHLVVIRESRSTLLVRQVRTDKGGEAIYETRSWYRAFGPTYVIHHSQTRLWHPDEDPRIVQEEHFFRSAEAFQQAAPTFFPFVSRTSDGPTVADVTEEVPR